MKSNIERIIHQAEKFKGAYFFTPPTNASARRSYEKYNSCPEITWEEGGHTYTAEFIVCCSCRNVYAAGYYTKDGNKTTLTAIRNSYKRLYPA